MSESEVGAMKWCSYGRHYTLLENFHKNPTKKDGLAVYCAPCVKRYQKLRSDSIASNPPSQETKKCISCFETKPITKFYRHSQNGRHSKCQSCMQRMSKERDASDPQRRERRREYIRNYFLTHKEEILKRKKGYPYKRHLINDKHSHAAGVATLCGRVRLRLEVLTAYGGFCACCGEAEYEFLVIDHVHGGGNAHRKAIGKQMIYRWLRQNNYPEGFRVLCHNCNMARGFYGECPHSRRKITEEVANCSIMVAVES